LLGNKDASVGGVTSANQKTYSDAEAYIKYGGRPLDQMAENVGKYYWGLSVVDCRNKKSAPPNAHLIIKSAPDGVLQPNFLGDFQMKDFSAVCLARPGKFDMNNLITAEMISSIL
jgi:hypothetical protein